MFSMVILQKTLKFNRQILLLAGKAGKINIIKSSTLFDFKINRKILGILFTGSTIVENCHYYSFFGYCNEKLEK